VARKTVFIKIGGDENDFVDVEPWTILLNSRLQYQIPAPRVPLSRGICHMLDMASLVDQADESELMPAPVDKVQEWSQRYVTVMGSGPEATDAQLAALYKRVVVLKQVPRTDFSVWLPFGRRTLRAQIFRTFGPLGDGTFVMKELPGPQNVQDWLASALQQYEKAVRSAWVLAEDKGSHSAGRRQRPCGALRKDPQRNHCRSASPSYSTS
jgi:hypothetical protein